MADVFAMSGNTPNFSGMLFNLKKSRYLQGLQGISNNDYTSFTPISERRASHEGSSC